ncbi:MAG: hypothetical protein K8R77_16755 [Anaerolineaceae bacterium]|nr:hypothetical protein [Anaerolineaceae bacterium]
MDSAGAIVVGPASTETVACGVVGEHPATSATKVTKLATFEIVVWDMMEPPNGLFGLAFWLQLLLLPEPNSAFRAAYPLSEAKSAAIWVERTFQKGYSLNNQLP